ncbi:hypothetical protein EB796_000612 [Bugula neritina]|uniref:KHDC4/BBP-like KH-domain type I domain-containing protein n=1 Tax=Bugula neritina TaxID=10212 RepID=A0A7J7KS95_BUGNE|nr:hypothetical protein EB796_000612 [Bugula neritina]
MEPQEQPESATYVKRPIKPEEQNLIDELARLTEQHADEFPNICQFMQKEVDRITKRQKSLEEEHYLDIEGGKPARLTFKVAVPAEKYPNFNYVGRLLGPKGSTLRGMQEISGCKMAVLGRGSMKDKNKEEQCRRRG